MITTVAILARPEGRALLDDRPVVTLKPQLLRSSPDPKAGRCAGAFPARGGSVKLRSSPDPKAGRCRIAVAAITPSTLLRSSPDPKAGRCELREGRLCTHPSVAILARPEGRALPQPTSAPRQPPTRCDPRPTRRPGAARPPTRRTRRSPRCCDPRPTRRPGAARPVRGGLPQHPAVAILARPEGRALRGELSDTARMGPQLRSSPDPLAGRCRAGKLLVNPAEVVAILARPEGRALRATPCDSVRLRELRSSPDPKAGRCPR